LSVLLRPLHAAVVSANFDGATFKNAVLDRVIFNNSSMKGVSFVNAVITGSEFEGVDLTGANFEGATADGATAMAPASLAPYAPPARQTRSSGRRTPSGCAATRR